MPVSSIFRLVRASWVLAREGVFTQVDSRHMPVQARMLLTFAKWIATRKQKLDRRGHISKAMEKLGPSYIKLGQFLATRPDIVGVQAANELGELQDKLSPFPTAQAIKIVEADIGLPINQIFLEFSGPVAAASIAQVHKARIDGNEGEKYVAVKILRPGVERRFRRDVEDMLRVARIAEKFSLEAQRLRLIEVVETLARSVKLEMDFRIEAAAASEFEENTRSDLSFRVPKVDWDRTSKNVLVIEWIDGTSLSDIEGLKKKGFDLPSIGKNVIQSFLRHAMRDGFFHADMHQGNLFIDEEGKLTAVDFGITGRLGKKERRFLAEILYGFITRNYKRVAEVHFEAGYVAKTYSVDDFAQAIRAIGEPIHSRTADQISMARLLALLFEVTALFEMKTRTELVLLQKTMVVVEGVARSLDPHLNLWSAAEPVVNEWIAENIGPKAVITDFRDSAQHLLRALPKVTELIERASESRELKSSEKRQPAFFPLSLHLALWVAVLLLAINIGVLLK
jgi:ubiquinone biosynthesis protein